MNIFTNKSIWQKIAIVLIIIILFQFIIASPVRAEEETIGGKLLSPVMSLVVTIGDAIISIIHFAVMGQSQSLINVDMSVTIWDQIGRCNSRDFSRYRYCCSNNFNCWCSSSTYWSFSCCYC